MDILLLIGLLIVVRLDVLTFQKINSELFLRTFQFSFFSKIIITLLTGSILAFYQEPVDILPVFLLTLATPLYIIRRREFLRTAGDHFANDVNDKIRSDACGVIIYWFFIIFLLSIVVRWLAAINPDYISELEEAILSTTFSSVVFLALIYHAAKSFQGATFREKIKLVKGKRSFVSVFVIPALIGLVFAWISAWLVAMRSVQPDTPLSDILDANTSLAAIIFFVALAVILAPLVEEIIFRGYFYRVLKQTSRQWIAIVVVALSFGALHVDQYWGDWTAIVMVGILGFVLTLVRVWTGSVLSSATVHYFYNTGVMIMTAVIMMIANPAYFDYSTRASFYDFPVKERLLKESIVIQPELAEAYYELAKLYLEESKKPEQGLIYIDKALALNDKSFRFLKMKLALLQIMDHRDDVKIIKAKIKDLYPDRDL